MARNEQRVGGGPTTAPGYAMRIGRVGGWDRVSRPSEGVASTSPAWGDNAALTEILGDDLRATFLHEEEIYAFGNRRHKKNARRFSTAFTRTVRAPSARSLTQPAATQLGRLCGRNHYVGSRKRNVWVVGVHFG